MCYSLYARARVKAVTRDGRSRTPGVGAMPAVRAFRRAELSLRPPRSPVTALRRPEHVPSPSRALPEPFPSPSRAFPNAAEIGREIEFLTVYVGFGPS